MDMDLKELISRIDNLQKSLRSDISPKALHDFIHIINELGYFDYQTLKDEQVDHSALVSEAIGYLKRYVESKPDDFVALNNLGVLLSNSGEIAASRRYFIAALKFAPKDQNIHENLRIQDILSGKSKSHWHKVPEELKKGNKTLISYFDPHGM